MRCAEKRLTQGTTRLFAGEDLRCFHRHCAGRTDEIRDPRPCGGGRPQQGM